MTNQQAAWTEGYRAESEYPSGVYPELNPDTLLLTLALQGIKPAAEIVANSENKRSLVYCELGCGQGMTLNLMAARDPNGQYFGVDYNANQVRNAREYAKDIGNENVHFSEDSFADLDKYDIPDCDIIVLHGIWSWISKSMQDCIVAFIRRKLKPGGIVYNSYNCAVGFSAMHPMRKLLMAAERTTSETEWGNQLTDSLGLSLQMAEAGAKYFAANPSAVEQIKKVPSYDPAYVKQEYFNSAWQLFFHDEMANQMAEAKLNFAGSATLINNRPELALPAEAAAFSQRLSSQSDIELLKDIWTNNTFRKDIYVRGIQTMTDAQTNTQLYPLLFRLSRPHNECKLKVQIPVGLATLPEKPYQAIFDAMNERPITGKEIADIVNQNDVTAPLSLLISTLIAIGFIHLVPASSEAERLKSAIERIESANKKNFTSDKNSSFGVLPGMHSVLNLNALQFFFWQANREGVKDKRAWVARRLNETGRSLVQKGVVVTDEKEAIEILKNSEEEFDKNIKPKMSI
ncbi:class I SAM-dependent methyltransferase [Kordiimonas aquimaris]|uniref:class I SAM-dependent methyltransferase n=1 Tax=Kordiimonas aquimaris TaxID=707591 RepID=UPI0021D399BF|nr:class I SAM-dependent methyltransferase [Kordiimonas aquimaris]